MNPALIQPNNKRAGLTLIEVLIALVILAIGVYAVLKIFPVGFGAIEATRQRTVAASLANAELERWKLLAGDMYTLPEAVVATDYGGSLILGYDPAELVPVQDDLLLNPGQTVPAWQPHSLWLPRTIIGERVIIPPPVPNPPNPPEPPPLPFYILAFAPLDYYITSPPAAADELIQVYDSAPFQRTGGAPSTWQYNVNYSTGVFTFDSGLYADTPFLITYSWVAADGSLRTVVGESGVTDAAGSLTVKWNPVDYPLLFQQLAPMTERVYLRYQESASTPPAAGEFYLDASSLMTGVIYFAPENTGREVRINYRVADWSILHEDHEIAANSAEPVNLNLGFLKGPGYTNPPRHPDPQTLPDGDNFVVAVDLATGAVYADQNPGGGQLFPSVDYRAGRIRFPTSAQPRPVRIFYRTRADWAVQFRKPADSYGASTTWPIGYGQFFWDNRDQQIADGETAAQYEARLSTLFFLGQEARGSLLISYYDSARNFHGGELHTLSTADRADAVPNVEFALQSNGGFLQDNALICFLRTDTVPDPQSSIIAHGASLSARTVWMSTGRSIVPEAFTFSGRREYLNEAWRQARVSTFLTTPMR
ncbi:MAG: prepilin-type N-terminal cleavage/methylation domain-containing protein [Armatimonadetes bacterium]|nr:prepilin-type N-terminal cleavage/methylation domain-containing protein [Armatimonadota bacterium]NIM23707.1 prepilin-type N-terminal cleavage/methylation domain-containing protein [Armatimonadota bacterium]NIM67584.1 prepilin-type N-terminal cleavage/methylation domain-containing protein [Armatimonadota bacterium]NIM76107.1 prepilin-type N-terminal cleavage/methylation domain-containing protein [Armatimonadota bacterium]NIN05790.1 prepilin-type N-terminal cleavage/methylation domain-contain